MDLHETANRIFVNHWRLIAACICLGLTAVAAAHMGSPRMYSASTRLVLDTQDPKTWAEAGAIADTAKGYATSPFLVRQAMVSARVQGRDPQEVAKGRVTVQPLGESGVLKLVVRDEDPRAAAAMSNALAAGVIKKRLEVSNGQLREVLGGVGTRLESLSQKISALDARIAARQSAGAAAGSRSLARLLRTRDALTEERGVLESTRSSAVSAGAQKPAAAVVSPAAVPAQADSSGLLPDAFLGAMLGAVLGVGIAALLEAFRPMLLGGSSLARELDAPLLGELSLGPDGAIGDDDADRVASRIQMAAKGAGVRSAELVGPRDGTSLQGVVDLGELARRLDSRSREAMLEPTGARGANDEPASPGLTTDARIGAFDSHSLSQSNGGGMGLVLVSPARLRKADLDSLKNLVRVAPGGLLGVVALGPSQWPSREVG
jgi:uncharacterized protein involved in exopolysaccharide biosynthesis